MISEEELTFDSSSVIGEEVSSPSLQFPSKKKSCRQNGHLVGKLQICFLMVSMSRLSGSLSLSLRLTSSFQTLVPTAENQSIMHSWWKRCGQVGLDDQVTVCPTSKGFRQTVQPSEWALLPGTTAVSDADISILRFELPRFEASRFEVSRFEVSRFVVSMQAVFFCPGSGT